MPMKLLKSAAAVVLAAALLVSASIARGEINPFWWLRR